MKHSHNQKEVIDENITKLKLDDYIIEFSGWNKRGNPHELIEKLYELGQDTAMDRDEKNRDLKSIIKEYMNN